MDTVIQAKDTSMDGLEEILKMRSKHQVAEILEHHLVGICHAGMYESVVERARVHGYHLVSADVISFYIDCCAVVHFGKILPESYNPNGEQPSLYEMFKDDLWTTSSIYIEPGAQGTYVLFSGETNAVMLPIPSLTYSPRVR